MKRKVIQFYQNYLFWIFIIGILGVKILLAGLFSSDYSDRMFLPFVSMFLENWGGKDWNIYQYYWENQLLSSFPYPPMMLFFLCLSGGFLCLFHPKTIFISNLFAKIPLFFFDSMILFYLIQLFPRERRYAAVLYYASPILLYSTYMHGQLDVIPTALLLVSFYYLKDGRENKKELLSAVFYGMALLSKFHVIAVFPLILLYLFRRGNLWKVMQYTGIVGVEWGVIVAPFWSEGFLFSVLRNTEQAVVKEVQVSFGSVSLYLPILAILLIYLIAFTIGRMNHDLLMSFCGMIFAVFLSLCPPMPGWYIWIVPFLVLFFIVNSKNRYSNVWLYAVFNFLYLIYFICFHRTEYVDLYFLGKDLSFLKWNHPTYKNMLFTLLSGMLFYMIWQMYQFGVASNSFYKRKNTPFTIGISGDSGSGKSTFLHILERALGRQNILFIEGDGDHRWERGEKIWEFYTHLNPKANYLYRQAKDIQRLRSGAATSRVEYDHITGTFSSAHRIYPRKYILICGLHSLYLPQMRRNLDLKIYMEVEEHLRRYWKIRRDMASRGYEKEAIVEQIEKRMPDARHYIYPQKKYADIRIQYFDKHLTDFSAFPPISYEAILSLRLFLSAAVDLEPLLLELERWEITADYDFSRDLEHQVVEFDGEMLKGKEIPFEEIAEQVIPQLDEVTKQKLTGLTEMEGILALFVLTLISKIMQEELE